MTLTALTVTTLEQMDQALIIRRKVFIEEQQVPEEIEIDEHDGDPTLVHSATHVLVLRDGAPVATGRLLPAHGDSPAHIGRVAVLAEHRRSGAGTMVMHALQDLARERGIIDITLAAQVHAVGFYERLGYVLREGDVFLDAGIEHRWMDIRLPPSPEA